MPKHVKLYQYEVFIFVFKKIFFETAKDGGD